MSNQNQHINPDTLLKSPAFSQVITTQGNGRTIYVGGQNAVNHKGELIGKGDLALQTIQVMENLLAALKAADADFSHVVKLTIYFVEGQDPRNAFAAAQKFIGDQPPPTVSGIIIAGLGNPDYLIEIDAIAFVAG